MTDRTDSAHHGEHGEAKSQRSYHHLDFINRELSWLAFNQRVLEEAEDSTNPLLERVRFLSISAGNMDEFYAVRVAGLVDQVRAGEGKKSVDGLTPTQQLETVRHQAWRMQQEQQRIWHSVRAELAKTGIVIESVDKLHHSDKGWLDKYFEEQVFPVLTPVDLNPTHPMPFIPSGGQALVLRLRDVDTHKHKADGLVVMPPQIPRFIRLPDKNGQIRFIALEYLIAHYTKRLFPGLHGVPTGMMRIVRNLDVDLEEKAEDLLNTFEKAVQDRRHGVCIHLEVEGTIPKHLVRKLGLERDEVVLLPKMAGMGDVKQLIVSDRPELLFSPFHAAMPQRVLDHDGDCFAAIKEKDLVVQHPYESYDVVVHFLQQAAQDPNVLSIKQSIYRTSHDSPIVHALIAAVEAGKSVTAVVELRARFDEEANINLARALEARGVQVVYGLAAYKTHAKMILVVRREGERLQSYAHFGTGNYHPSTAKIYTDISFFTCDPVLVEDAARLFNYATGCAKPHLQALCCSPLTIRSTLVELVQAEIAHARAGRPAQIWLKMNSLVDPQLIELLYDASQAGVSVKAVVRGICCLRPGVKGLSENIEIHSIVGRYLEHARVFAFGNGEGLPSPYAKLYISSADWMKRNMDRRIEAMVPITDPAAHAHILNQIMVVNMRDTLRSWKLLPNGKWERMAPGNEPLSAHDYFMAHPSPAYGEEIAPVGSESRTGVAVQES
ncbi:RNA degradosome polyphosphate kinase [Bombella sp. ESL0385]|uniref:RNA degradosome polyphosphate kinase n=1 Tax=Bombella sp. ESL0385 TaxID=2676446 RepID=UPI00351B232F